MDRFNIKQVIKNTSMLYILSIVQLALPLVTLPYLTRVLSIESYGLVSYLKSVTNYMNVIIDFGFILSATKDIVNAGSDKEKIGKITGDVIIARIFLAIISFLVLLIMIATIPLLKNNILFTLLSFLPSALSIFLLDFLFRGLEKMEVITFRYLVMKLISTVFTFIVVRSDSDLLWIPILDTIGTAVAMGLIIYEVKNIGIRLSYGSIKTIMSSLKESSLYFVSNMASTAFMALNTFLIGILLSSKQIAYWSIAMQLVTLVQALYSPISSGIYPQMVRSKNLNLVKKVLYLFIPIVFLGCIFIYFKSDLFILIVGGEKYLASESIIRSVIPVIFFSFLSMIFGWPVLGAINRVKETTYTTLIAAFLQVIGIFLLIIFGEFTLINIALLRGVTEFILFILRFGYTWKYKAEFLK